MSDDFPEFWNEFVFAQAMNMNSVHEYITETLSREIPIHIIRYEDLVIDPEHTLTECFKFLLETDSLEGTILEQRIQAFVNAGISKYLVIKPGGKRLCSENFGSPSTKVTNSSIDEPIKIESEDMIDMNLNQSADMYYPGLKLELKEILCDYNHFYGYTDREKNEDEKTSRTAFFSYQKGEVHENRIRGYE